MILIKTRPNLTEFEFIQLAKAVDVFYSLKGKRYVINDAVDNKVEETKMLHIKRESGKPWPMNLLGVFKAYHELTDFKTENFKPYVLSRTHSPSLGLLLHLQLLKAK